MTTPLHIAIEGVIGVGKTTLARALAAELGAIHLSEDVLQNPFLADFYRNRARYALACQLWFLEARLEQFAQARPAAVPVVADHSLDKEALFAAVNLKGAEADLHKRLLQRLAPTSGFEPPVIVWLKADVEAVIDRIRGRGRAAEGGIETRYLQSLNAAYEQWYEGPGSQGRRVVVVDTHGHFIAEDRAAVGRLAEACAKAPKGLSYCNPVA